MKWLKEHFYPVNWCIQVQLNFLEGGVSIRGGDMRRYLVEFRDALAECPELDDMPAKVLFLK